MQLNDSVMCVCVCVCATLLSAASQAGSRRQQRVELRSVELWALLLKRPGVEREGRDGFKELAHGTGWGVAGKPEI